MKSQEITAFFTDREVSTEVDELLRLSGFRKIYLPIQKHTDRVKIIQKGDEISEPVIADGVITTLEGLLIGVKTADCVPVLISSTCSSVVAAVHAGWRGTARLILKKTLQTMIDRFSLSADDILIAIGPSIRGCCYEVGREVAESIGSSCSTDALVRARKGRLYVDLVEANLLQATATGIPEENIWVSKSCTCCERDRFFSYRATKTEKRQGGFIGIKSP